MHLSEPPHRIIAMLLLALAWTRPTRPAAGPVSRGHWASLGGPALLVALGLSSHAPGPQALAMAYGLLGIIAGMALMVMLARHTPAHSLMPQRHPPRTGSTS